MCVHIQLFTFREDLFRDTDGADQTCMFTSRWSVFTISIGFYGLGWQKIADSSKELRHTFWCIFSLYTSSVVRCSGKYYKIWAEKCSSWYFSTLVWFRPLKINCMFYLSLRIHFAQKSRKKHTFFLLCFALYFYVGFTKVTKTSISCVFITLPWVTATLQAFLGEADGFSSRVSVFCLVCYSVY